MCVCELVHGREQVIASRTQTHRHTQTHTDTDTDTHTLSLPVAAAGCVRLALYLGQELHGLKAIEDIRCHVTLFVALQDRQWCSGNTTAEQ